MELSSITKALTSVIFVFLPVNPGVFVNIQQVNVQQPREVNFGLGEQHFKGDQHEDSHRKKVEGSRPNDKFLEGFYNRSVLVPSVLQKIFSLRSDIIRKREEGTAKNVGVGNKKTEESSNSAAVACGGESGPCMTDNNQTRDGSKQLDIDIPSDINISSDQDLGIEISSSKKTDESTNSDNSTDFSTPSDRDEDIGTFSVDIDTNESVDIDRVKDDSMVKDNFAIQYPGSRNFSFTEDIHSNASNHGIGGLEKEYRSLKTNIAVDGWDILGNQLLKSPNSEDTSFNTSNLVVNGGDGQIKDIDGRKQTVLDGCEHRCTYDSGDPAEHQFLTGTEKDRRSPDIARVLTVLAKLLVGSRDTATFLLAESLAPARQKWRFVVNEAEVKSFLFHTFNNSPYLPAMVSTSPL